MRFVLIYSLIAPLIRRQSRHFPPNSIFFAEWEGFMFRSCLLFLPYNGPFAVRIVMPIVSLICRTVRIKRRFGLAVIIPRRTRYIAVIRTNWSFIPLCTIRSFIISVLFIYGLCDWLFQGITVPVFDGNMGKSEHKALRTDGCDSRGGGHKALKRIEKTRPFLNFKNGRASCWWPLRDSNPWYHRERVVS